MSGGESPVSYTLELDGRRLEVEATTGWKESRAVLRVDGEQVDAAVGALGKARLTGPDLEVKVSWGWLGGVRRCDAVPRADGNRLIAFAPPPGTRAARLADLARERPRMYAARHVAIAVAQVLATVVGVGAIFAGLLPVIPLPSIPLPDIDPPNLPLPDISLPDLPGWVSAILESSRYWLPVAIAIGVSIREVKRRRKGRLHDPR